MAGGRIGDIWIPYCGAAPVPEELLWRWNLDWMLLAGLIAAAAMWHLTVYRRERTGLVPFAAGMGVLAVLFVSPFCALTSALFAARAAHHALLIALAAPLLVWALPLPRRTLPVGAWTAIAAIILWAWHIPALYAAALASDALYWAMQASLLGSAIGFWSAVRRASMPAAVGALLASMVQMGLLGAILTFSSRAFYTPHFLSTAAWGYTPLEDQQLAGLVMSAPAAAFYLLAALLIAGRWIGAEDRAAA